MTRLAAAFERARAENRAALLGYLPAGFPTRKGCVDALRAMVESGVDVIELGVPYSDPLMDGPVIQQAVDRALASGTKLQDVLTTVQELSDCSAAVVVMTYWNPIERHGPATFARELAAAGGVGAITPDLIPDEASEWLAAVDDANIDPVFLVAPSSTDVRLKTVCDVSRGFIYAASTMGVTGTRDKVSDRAAELVRRVKAVTDKPVGVGLGVSSGAQAAEVAPYADGVIVGSAFVRPLLDNPGPEGIAEVSRLAAELARGVRGH